MMKKSQDWTPVRSGSIYCSPACGGGCTWRQYETAVIQASSLARSLGAGWKPRVHENLGWHYSATNGVATMVERVQTVGQHYTLFINTSPQIVTVGASASECIERARVVFEEMKEAIEQTGIVVAALTGASDGQK